MSNSNYTQLSINDINDDHMIQIAPDYEMANPKVTETFADEGKFTVWFENLAKRHSNWNVTNTHFSQATSTASLRDVVLTVYFVCDHQEFLKKAKNGCKAKITKKTLRDESVQVDYLWQHATHQPENKAIKTLLRINPQRLDELKAGIDIASFPMSLRINYHDTSVEQWIEFLEKEKNYLVHIVFHEGNGPYLVSWISPWQKKILELADEWCIDSTHKTCKSLVDSSKHSYLYTIVVRSNVTNKGVPVCFFVTNAEFITTLLQWLNWVKSNCSLCVKCMMIDCSPVEIGALEEDFGQSVQVLLCHWHIKRAWEMHIKKDVKITGATHKSKCEQNAVWVALNLLIHARSKEHAKCALWSMAWRVDARFYTDNLIESYYHILKAYYLGRSRNFWTDWLVYMLSQVVEHDYRQEGLKIMYRFKQLVLTYTEKSKKKKAYDIAHEDALGMIYKCCSFTDNSVWYKLLVKEEVLSVCSCPDPNHLFQIVDQSEKSSLAQNRLRALEFVERHSSLINKIAQAVGKINAVARDTASGMDITSQILEDCLSSLKESGVSF
ncbi:hypothetical protein PHYBLDRAFT_151921 [Phycomyces blakesleeanus NRRL 1555(-)]|uniref:MULE transposase domain-containing protein n=1 Tax=Phycomyces blakesleeanus (strain ATCC 8743b / DSM 1359 / FGSC 10004 / NBRC 33097 / NRRL 1555) TaxID=763407 RepID=A0A162TGL5_PHYB8|nr:hypothetical protein PHYBLDRAFT_151921 [Phycomyces blakesleeanus NRRL 1555(-)]OAD66983.1 hypothetical protein PHYBLDRAFT_151921 [Phycomyces blakesleeanus NRRL 1555(-)]|eukprot:XP_018285023.1 hypothetical protein PHYBLDRAFT_151921 [Phycomyces blakesleeanus NRRL 1555(-)]